MRITKNWGCSSYLVPVDVVVVVGDGMVDSERRSLNSIHHHHAVGVSSHQSVHAPSKTHGSKGHLGGSGGCLHALADSYCVHRHQSPLVSRESAVSSWNEMVFGRLERTTCICN
jgi:hypothetical protein